MIEVTVEAKRCQGHGRCALIAPDLFDVSDDGVGYVLSGAIGVDQRDDAEEAASSCPEQAITVR